MAAATETKAAAIVVVDLTSSMVFAVLWQFGLVYMGERYNTHSIALVYLLYRCHHKG
jgi:hypothetical protein